MDAQHTQSLDRLYAITRKGRLPETDFAKLVLEFRFVLDEARNQFSNRSDPLYRQAEANIREALADFERTPGPSLLSILGGALAVYRVAALSQSTNTERQRRPE